MSCRFWAPVNLNGTQLQGSQSLVDTVVDFNMISGTTVAQPVKPVLKSEKDRNGSNEAAATTIKKVRDIAELLRKSKSLLKRQIKKLKKKNILKGEISEVLGFYSPNKMKQL